MNTLTRKADLIYTEWTLIEPAFDPAKLRARETVFTIGNGYLASCIAVRENCSADETGASENLADNNGQSCPFPRTHTKHGQDRAGNGGGHRIVERRSTRQRQESGYCLRYSRASAMMLKRAPKNQRGCVMELLRFIGEPLPFLLNPRQCFQDVGNGSLIRASCVW
jgi:hypothetical protein